MLKLRFIISLFENSVLVDYKIIIFLFTKRCESEDIKKNP